MRALYRRDLGEDRGSIILALLGIIILTTVASVGLAAVVNGQKQSRHDNTFVQALNNAESGIDAMVANIKGAFNSASLPTSTNMPQLHQSGVYDVTVNPHNNIDSSGNASSTTWTITSKGYSTVTGHQITRTVTEVVTIAHTYHVPVLGTTNLSLPAGSGVSNYQIGGLTQTDGSISTPTPTSSQMISQGLTLSVLGIPLVGGGSLTGTLGSTTISNVPVGDTPGAAETGGTLSLSSSDLQNFAQVALDNGETCASTGAGSGVCNSSTVVTEPGPTPTITTPGCNGSTIGANVNGIPLTVPNNILVLNTTVDAQLFPPGVSIQQICTNLPIVIPTIGTNLNGLTALPGLSGLSGLTGLGGTLDVPIGSSCTDLSTNQVLTTLSTTAATGNLSCKMNDPNTLYFNEVGTNVPVYLGTGSSVPTYVSAIVNDPNGTCYINGNVVLYGAINCKSIQAAPGATNVSLTVYYPTDETALTYDDTQHKDTVANWNEVH